MPLAGSESTSPTNAALQARSRFLFRAVAARIAGDRVELTGKAQYDPNAADFSKGLDSMGDLPAA